jgi:dipeptidyl aminopeptidase/acylaminoacyl peptidase
MPQRVPALLVYTYEFVRRCGMRRLLVLLFTILYIIPAVLLVLDHSAFSQTKHPFTFDDMMALKRVGDPQPSPDGKWVLFSVTDVSLEANTKTPHVWAVPTAGGESREIIFTQSSDRPRWAPDGKHFAFTSTQEGGSQIWIADFDGAIGKVTATHKLTSIATEADGELWSPDGKNILFVSNIYPECDGAPDAEAACNAKELEEHQKSKVKALIFDHLLYRHWNAYKEGMRSHIFVVPTTCVGTGAPPVQPGEAGQSSSGPNQGSRAALDRTGEGACPYKDLTPGDYDAPVFSLGGQDNYAFSPDGQEVAYSSNQDKVEATSTNGDIWLVSVNGGTAKNITTDNPAGDFTPLYSPDGKYIAYRSQRRPGYESDRFRLMLYDRKTGEKKNLTESFDRWVGTIAWAPDSRSLYFTAENAGNSPVYRTAYDDVGKISEITAGFNDEISVLNGGRTILFTRMGLQGPNEIYLGGTELPSQKPCIVDRLSPPGSPAWYETADCALPKAAPLTQLNASLFSQISMSPLEPFWFEGAHSDKVEGFLVKPPSFNPNQKYPVKFLVHGGPEGAWGDDWSYRWNPELFAANGYVVVMINFHGSTGYGQKFIDAINGDWGGAPFEDLMKGLDYAEKTYPFIDKDRECALGASYGGYMMNWLLGHTDRFKCIVTHDGMFNSTSAWGTTEELWFNEWEFKGTPYTNRELYDKWSPHLAGKNFKTPTLVVHGQLDYRLDVSEGFQLFTTLQRLGVPSKMLYFPDEGHWVLKPQNSQLWYKTVNDWVDQWTKK